MFTQMMRKLSDLGSHLARLISLLSVYLGYGNKKHFKAIYTISSYMALFLAPYNVII